MKGLNLFLAVCFAVPTFDGAMAAPTKNSQRTTQSNTRLSQTNTRNTNTVKSRNTTNTRSTKNIVSRQNTTTTARTAVTPRDTTTTARTTKRIGTRTAATTTRSGISRSATVQTRESIMQRDFGKCKSVFFDCMDEFCANKDTQLKRCACSSRANEFSATQKSLNNVEDKLLDFSQRLLQVNMDPADAAVINQESAGERAYNATRDKTQSKKTLDAIAEKLNTNFDSAGNNMSALSWSLDMDSAFDSVDSLGGISTTSKSGVALRNAALPICREMAAEVCTDDDITLVENSYNMTIEQDCNTVKQAYETQVQSARTKILESSALLDMTRLNNYQENNSDDILTCKSKMLNMLTNTNVCGENLTKCLDISGRYINPTTGEAFLSPDLVNLSTLITRPTTNDTWAKTPKNSAFVSYLNSKKKYLESATKNCQEIADDVWTAFLDDALAQIKLAQNAKLEEVRQSCTTLFSQCLDNARESLSEFDPRALSTFGVMTDKTVNALCENVKKSCAVVMDYSPDDSAVITYSADTDWQTGVTNIAAAETYNTIINTCREIGRDCIINSCKSISGNFGLCESIHDSVNRHSILTRAACWNEVKNCVAQASKNSINDIHNLLLAYNPSNSIPQDLYEQMYSNALDAYNNNSGITDRNIYDICRTENKCTADSNNHDIESTECYYCRIAEQIWGHCKSKPDNSQTNPILIPNTDSNSTTLLSWFASNTHTQYDTNSCATSICPAGSLDYTIGTTVQCVNPSDVIQCTQNGIVYENILCQAPFVNTPISNIENCCPTNVRDQWGNCCMDGGVANTVIDYMTDNINPTFTSLPNGSFTGICTHNSEVSQLTFLTAYNYTYSTTTTTTRYVFCSGTVSTNSNDSIICSGKYILLEQDTNNQFHYINATPNGATDINLPNFEISYDANYFVNADKDDETNYCPASNGTQTNKCTWFRSGSNKGWMDSSQSACTDASIITGNWLVDL